MADVEERVAEMYDEPAPKDKHDNSRILVISDMHAPYHHKDTLKFLRMLKGRYNPTRVISVGDEQDLHAASFHDSDPDLMSAGDELKAAREFLGEVESLFPEMDILSSNHGDLYYRKAKHHGIPMHVIKSYNDVLGVGKGWKWHSELVVELPDGKKVYFCHGKSQNGLKLSQNMGMSCVQGHYHNSFNIQYWSSPLELHFSMQVGCLVDDKSLAMAYNKLTVNRPIIGCGLIIDGVPILEAMPL
jgi:metallophosphoesterase superfamily enzyme